MSQYIYADLSWQQFEDLVCEICLDLLGPGYEGFAEGADGGRDGKFVGTAQKYPSSNDPLSGVFIIQSKHTNFYNASFSETDFTSDAKSALISKEIEKIKRLVVTDNLEHYFLFSNRKKTAGVSERIESRIKAETGLDSVHIFGVERLDKFVKHDENLQDLLDRYKYQSPITVNPEQLAEVVLQISDRTNGLPKHVGARSLDVKMKLKRVEFKKKNTLNGLSDDFAKFIESKFLKYFTQIDDFLGDPRNSDVFDFYEMAKDELQQALIVYRSKYEEYDELLHITLNRLIGAEPDLKLNLQLTKAVFFYMYWVCDIGTCSEMLEDD